MTNFQRSGAEPTAIHMLIFPESQGHASVASPLMTQGHRAMRLLNASPWLHFLEIGNPGSIRVVSEAGVVRAGARFWIYFCQFLQSSHRWVSRALGFRFRYGLGLSEYPRVSTTNMTVHGDIHQDGIIDVWFEWRKYLEVPNFKYNNASLCATFTGNTLCILISQLNTRNEMYIYYLGTDQEFYFHWDIEFLVCSNIYQALNSS